MKKILSLFMFVMCIAVGANAQSGTTENGLSWKVENRVLTITGSGAIKDNEAPWGTKFSTVIIGEGVTSIGANAFKDCIGIKSVFYFGNSSLFDDWTIYDVFNGVVIKNIAFYRSPSSNNLYGFNGYFKANSSNEILWTLLNGVFTVKSNKAMTANGDLEGIDDNPRIMISISTISVENATALVSENGALLSSDRSKLLLACNKSGSTVVVPETVKRIGAYAFYATPSITVKSLNATAPTLSNNSFNVNRKIAKLNIPNNFTADAYSAWAPYFETVVPGEFPSSGTFDGISWSIADNVLTISGSGVLNNNKEMRDACSNYTVNKVRVGSGITEIADNAFYGIDAVEYTFNSNANISEDSNISEDATLNLQLTDKVDLAANVNTFDKVTLNRTFAAGATGTLILPFATTAPVGFKLYTIESYNNKVLTFADNGNAVQANTPYIYKNDSGSSWTPSSKDVTFSGLNNVYEAAADGWTMCGAYQSKTEYNNNADEASTLWVYTTSEGKDGNGFGKFKNYAKSVTVSPYRVFFKGTPYNEVYNSSNTVNSYAPERSLSVEFVDMDGTTSITEIIIDKDGNISSAAEDGAYYDLSGRRVENPTTGIYIVNGKKVLVK